MENSEIVERVTRKANSIQQAKAGLMEEHNKWLESNDLEKFYQRPIHAWRVERILDFVKDIHGKVLDIGCFAGIVAERIMKQGNKEVIGLDRLEKALELASERGVQTILGDIDDAVIDFPDNHFDCVLAGDVLNSVYDPDAVVEEINRVLKPGGKLIVTVPNLTCICNRLLMMLGRAPHNLEVRARQGAGTLRLFTFDTMRRLLCDHGLDVLTMESSVVVFPLIRFQLNRWPWVWRFFAARPDWHENRIFFSKFIARIFPKLGENIIALAKKRVTPEKADAYRTGFRRIIERYC